MISPGHKLLIYIAGNESKGQRVIASALVATIEQWSDKLHKDNYPLLLDGIPDKVLRLHAVREFKNPIDFKSKLDALSFIPSNKKKWGVAMMGGARSLIEADYKMLCA